MQNYGKSLSSDLKKQTKTTPPLLFHFYTWEKLGKWIEKPQKETSKTHKLKPAKARIRPYLLTPSSLW